MMVLVCIDINMRVIILLSLLGAAVAASSAGPQRGQRIVGGEETTIDQHPFMSNMQFLWAGVVWYQVCGGSLINSRSVLSAAHCYTGSTAASWRVLLGTSFASSGGSTHPASLLILHPGYNGITVDNDIALVRLAVPATFSNTVAAVGIAGPNYIVPDGAPVTAIGWGALSAGGGSFPEQLRHVDINIISQAFCTERYAYLKTLPNFENWPDVTDNMICAGIQHIGGKDACQGDSGGPLVHNRDVLVGITSWGYGCAHPDYPGVNVRVSRYTDWIVASA